MSTTVQVNNAASQFKSAVIAIQDDVALHNDLILLLLLPYGTKLLQ